MDWQRIKERVTGEVMAQLTAGGIEATPEQVAAAVAAIPAPRPAVGDDFSTDVLVVLAGPVDDQVLALTQALAGTGTVTVVAAEQADRLAGLGIPVLTGGDEITARRLVRGARRIIAPVVTTAAVTSIAQLVGTNLANSVLVQAAFAGKAATLARDGAEGVGGANWALRRKVEEAVAALRTLGFTITDLESLAAEVARMAPAPQPAARAEAAPAGGYDRELARFIDHTLLKPEATAEQVIKLCKEAREYQFMSVCVNPGWVPLAAEQLASSGVKVCTVIGFPLGATTTESKAYEAAQTVRDGATEVDMVLNVGALKSGQYDRVLDDVKAVVDVARGKALTKVILETGLLTDAEKVKACQLCKEAGADFVKTSTGFGPGGATVEDIALMRRTVGPDLGVKASGGIRDYEAAMAMVKAGATRIGASASVNIVKRLKAQPAKGKY